MVIKVPGAGGVPIAVCHLGGEGQPLVAVHATGFCGGCFAPMAPALVEDFSMWTLDLRGHGASGRSANGRYDDWYLLAEDLLAVLDAVAPGPWRGIGHSCGGAILLLAEQRRPGTFAGLFCYEPIIFPPHRIARVHEGGGLAEVVRRRRPGFPSREAARENYASKPPFSRFDPSVLDAYLDCALVEAPEGGVMLSCTPEAEASVYEGSTRHDAYERLVEVTIPVVLAAGGEKPDIGPDHLAELAARLPDSRIEVFEGLSHFGPMEQPLRVGEAARKAFLTP